MAKNSKKSTTVDSGNKGNSVPIMVADSSITYLSEGEDQNKASNKKHSAGPYYHMNLAADNEKSAEIYLIGVIGYDWWTDTDNTAKPFIAAVNELGDLDRIDLYINSPGGNVYDGLQIYNFLKRHKAQIITHVDGEASSIASVVAMAGEQVHMPANTLMMIHDPASVLFGWFTADEMRGFADALDTIKTGIITAYQDKTGMSEEDIWDLMAVETYMTAQEAVEYGFADYIDEPLQAVAMADKDLIRGVAVQQAKALMEKRNPPGQSDSDARQIIAACGAEDFVFMAPEFLAQNLTLAEAKDKLARAAKIRDLCASTGYDIDPTALIKEADDPVNLLRTALAVRMEQDDPDITGHLQPEQIAGGSGRLPNPTEIYANRKKRM